MKERKRGPSSPRGSTPDQHSLLPAFELLASMPEDFFAQGRDDPPPDPVDEIEPVP